MNKPETYPMEFSLPDTGIVSSKFQNWVINMRNSFKTLQYFQYALDTVMSFFFQLAKAEKSF